MRKQIGIKLNEELIKYLDGYCAEKRVTRTAFIENAIKKNLPPIPKRDSGWRWNGGIEDMPIEI